MSKKLSWAVEFFIDETWVADGFDLTENRALDMLSNDLSYAFIETELGVRIISTPDPRKIARLQGYKSVKEMRDANVKQYKR